MSSFLVQDFAEFYSLLTRNPEKLLTDIQKFQSEKCKVYTKWLANSPYPSLDGVTLPFSFLPIRFYKNHLISSVPDVTPELIFESSGTSGQTPSRNPLFRPDFYKKNSIHIFNESFGRPVTDFRILALLPHYLERGNSSLVHMVQDWMNASPIPGHNFFMHDTDGLLKSLAEDIPTLLLGVTYALIDLVPHISTPLSNCTVIETGGMKGRAENWTKTELHNFLHKGLGCEIYSEYGMTELMSQAYMKRGERFFPPPQIRVMIREETDPLTLHGTGRGGLNIIDMANMDTLSFIATDDLAYVHEDGSFEILGRLDQSDVRGCSQMYFL